MVYLETPVIPLIVRSRTVYAGAHTLQNMPEDGPVESPLACTSEQEMKAATEKLWSEQIRLLDEAVNSLAVPAIKDAKVVVLRFPFVSCARGKLQASGCLGSLPEHLSEGHRRLEAH
jgi:hypothetical protein